MSDDTDFIERLRSFGRFYVVPITEQTEWALEKWLREHGYKFSIPILPGETLEQAMKRQTDKTGPVALLNQLMRVSQGVGAWLLHRFGPDSPEGREGQTLLDATRQAVGDKPVLKASEAPKP